MLPELVIAIIFIIFSSVITALSKAKRKKFYEALQSSSYNLMDERIDEVFEGTEIKPDTVKKIKQEVRKIRNIVEKNNAKKRSNLSDINTSLDIDAQSTASTDANSSYDSSPFEYNKFHHSDVKYEIDEPDENEPLPTFEAVEHEVSNLDDDYFGYSFHDEDAINKAPDAVAPATTTIDCNDKYNKDVITDNCLYINDYQSVHLNEDANVGSIKLEKNDFNLNFKDGQTTKLSIDAIDVIKDAKNIKLARFDRSKGVIDNIKAQDGLNIVGTFRTPNTEIILPDDPNSSEIEKIFYGKDATGMFATTVTNNSGIKKDITIDKKKYTIGNDKVASFIDIYNEKVKFVYFTPQTEACIDISYKEGEDEEEKVHIEAVNVGKVVVDKKTNKILSVLPDFTGSFQIKSGVSFSGEKDGEELKINLCDSNQGYFKLTKYEKVIPDNGEPSYYHIVAKDYLNRHRLISSNKINLDTGQTKIQEMKIFDDKIELYPKNGKIPSLYLNNKKIIGNGENIESITIDRKTGLMIGVKGKVGVGVFEPLIGNFKINNSNVYLIKESNVGSLQMTDSVVGNENNNNAVKIESVCMANASGAIECANLGGIIAVVSSSANCKKITSHFVKPCEYNEQGLKQMCLNLDTARIESAIESKDGDPTMPLEQITLINERITTHNKEIDQPLISSDDFPDEEFHDKGFVRLKENPANSGIFQSIVDVDDFAFYNVRIVKKVKKDPSGEEKVHTYLTWTKNNILAGKLTTNSKITIRKDDGLGNNPLKKPSYGTAISSIEVADSEIKIPVQMKKGIFDENSGEVKGSEYTAIPVKKNTTIVFVDNPNDAENFYNKMVSFKSGDGVSIALDSVTPNPLSLPNNTTLKVFQQNNSMTEISFASEFKDGCVKAEVHGRVVTNQDVKKSVFFSGQENHICAVNELPNVNSCEELKQTLEKISLDDATIPYFDLGKEPKILLSNQLIANITHYEGYQKYTPAGSQYITGVISLNNGRQIKLTDESRITKMFVYNTHIDFEVNNGQNGICKIKMTIPSDSNGSAQNVDLINTKDVHTFSINKNGDMMSLEGDRVVYYVNESVRLNDKCEIKLVDSNMSIDKIEYNTNCHKVTLHDRSTHCFEMFGKKWQIKGLKEMYVYDNKVVFQKRNGGAVNLTIDGNEVIKDGESVSMVEIDPKTFQITKVKSTNNHLGGTYLVNDVKVYVPKVLGRCNVDEIEKGDTEYERLKIKSQLQLRVIIQIKNKDNNDVIRSIKTVEIPNINGLSIGKDNKVSSVDGGNVVGLSNILNNLAEEDKKADDEEEVELVVDVTGDRVKNVCNNFALCGLKVVSKLVENEIKRFLRWKKVPDEFRTTLNSRAVFTTSMSSGGIKCTNINVANNNLKVFALQNGRYTAIDVDENTNIVLDDSKIKFTPKKGTMLSVDGVNRHENNQCMPFFLGVKEGKRELTLYRDTNRIAEFYVADPCALTKVGDQDKQARHVYLSNNDENKILWVGEKQQCGGNLVDDVASIAEQQIINSQFRRVNAKTSFAVNNNVNANFFKKAPIVDGSANNNYAAFAEDSGTNKDEFFIKNPTGSYELDNGEKIILDNSVAYLSLYKDKEIGFWMRNFGRLEQNAGMTTRQRIQFTTTDNNKYCDCRMDRNGRIVRLKSTDTNDDNVKMKFAELDKNTQLRLEGCVLKSIEYKADNRKYVVDTLDHNDNNCLASKDFIKFINNDSLDISKGLIKEAEIDDYDKANGTIKLVPKICLPLPPALAPLRVPVQIKVGAMQIVDASTRSGIESILLDRKTGTLKQVKFFNGPHEYDGKYTFDSIGTVELKLENNVALIERTENGIKLTAKPGQTLGNRITFIGPDGKKEKISFADFEFKDCEIGVVDGRARVLSAICLRFNTSAGNYTIGKINDLTREIDENGNDIDPSLEPGCKDVEMKKQPDGLWSVCQDIDDFVFSEVQIVKKPDANGHVQYYLRFRYQPNDNGNRLRCKLSKNAKFKTVETDTKVLIDEIITSPDDRLKLGVYLEVKDAENKNDDPDKKLTVFDVKPKSTIFFYKNSYSFTPHDITTMKHKNINNGKPFLLKNNGDITNGSDPNCINNYQIRVNMDNNKIVKIHTLMKLTYGSTENKSDCFIFADNDDRVCDISVLDDDFLALRDNDRRISPIIFDNIKVSNLTQFQEHTKVEGFTNIKKVVEGYEFKTDDLLNVRGNFPINNNGDMLNLTGTGVSSITNCEDSNISPTRINFKPHVKTTLNSIKNDGTTSDILTDVITVNNGVCVTIDKNTCTCKEIGSLAKISGVIHCNGVSFTLSNTNTRYLLFRDRNNYFIEADGMFNENNFKNLLHEDFWSNCELSGISAITVENNKIILFPAKGAFVSYKKAGSNFIIKGENINKIVLDRKTGAVMTVEATVAKEGDGNDKIGLGGNFNVNGINVVANDCHIGKIDSLKKRENDDNVNANFIEKDGVKIDCVEQKWLTGRLSVNNNGGGAWNGFTLDKQKIKSITVNREKYVIDAELLVAPVDADAKTIAKNNIIRALNKTRTDKRQEQEEKIINNEIAQNVVNGNQNNFAENKFYRLELEEKEDNNGLITYSFANYNANRQIAQHVNISEMSIKTVYDKNNHTIKRYLQWKYNEHGHGTLAKGTKIFVKRDAMGLKLSGIKFGDNSKMYIKCTTPYDKDRLIKIRNGGQIACDNQSVDVLFDDDTKITRFKCDNGAGAIDGNKIIHPNIKVLQQNGVENAWFQPDPDREMAVYNDTYNLAKASILSNQNNQVTTCATILRQKIKVQNNDIEFENSEKNSLLVNYRNLPFFNHKIITKS